MVGSIGGNMSGLLHYIGENKAVEVPMWMVAATDGVHKVIIDTGIDELEPIVSGPEPNCHRRSEQRTVTALRSAMGWEASEVDTVVNTHLHFDHCGGNRFFKNARLLVQRDEWEAANSPIPSTAFLYYEPYFSKNTISYFQWQFTSGEEEVYPGMLVLPTPGHTLGHQSVLIDTEEGTLCVAGDAVNIADNINTNTESSIVVDSRKVFSSFASIREKADRIIPGHEFRIQDLSENGFPQIL